MSSIAMLAAVVASMATVATAATAATVAMVALVIWLYNCFSPKLTHIPSFAKGEICVSLPETGRNQIGLPKPNALR